MSRIFSDYDGTWDSHNEIHNSVEAIVTGNSWQNSSDIFDVEGPMDIPIFFNPVTDNSNDQGKIITHKANIINQCGVTKFYEDQPQEAAQLRILCPDCKIVLVGKSPTKL